MDPRTEKMLAERRQPVAAGLAAGGRRPAYVQWLTEHWRVASILGAVLIVAAVAWYYLFVIRPAAEQQDAALYQQRARQAIETELDTNQASLEACLTAIEVERVALWDAACREHRQRKGCSLLRDVAEQHQRANTDKRADCLKRYSLGTVQP